MNTNDLFAMQALKHAADSFDARIEQLRKLLPAQAQREAPGIEPALLQAVRKVEQKGCDALTDGAASQGGAGLGRTTQQTKQRRGELTYPCALLAEHWQRQFATHHGLQRYRVVSVLAHAEGFQAQHFTRCVEPQHRLLTIDTDASALTLNGLAQGYITDRVADLLRAAEFEDVLIDLGEARALGRRADGRAWHAAVQDPRDPARTLFELPLGNEPGALSALATSAGAGTRFGADPRIHHLFDPRTGRSANHYLSVSVTAPRATLADGLSTALSVTPPEAAEALLAGYPSARAFLLDADGRLHTVTAIT